MYRYMDEELKPFKDVDIYVTACHVKKDNIEQRDVTLTPSVYGVEVSKP